jgi:formylglycine-generating enzyme
MNRKQSLSLSAHRTLDVPMAGIASAQKVVDKSKILYAARGARGERGGDLRPYTLLAAYLEQMQLIPGGTFQRGGRVTLSDFWMGRTLVPQEIWREYRRGEMPKAPRWGWKAHHPMVNVSWYDVLGFCDWVSDVSGVAFAMPTEAQWEYAARGGGKDVTYPWGSTFDSSKLVHEGNSRGRSAPVDRSDRVYAVKFSNGSELLDMAGNVWQWCYDWYDSYLKAPVTNPTGPSSMVLSKRFKIIRGGSFYCASDSCAERNNTYPDSGDRGLGFRLCCKA